MPTYDDILADRPLSVRKAIVAADVDRLRTDLKGFRDRITEEEYEQSLAWINVMDSSEWEEQPFHWGEEGRLEPVASAAADDDAAAADSSHDDDAKEGKSEAVGIVQPRAAVSTSRRAVHVVEATGTRFRVGDCCVLLAALDSQLSDEGRLLRFHVARIIEERHSDKMRVHWFSSFISLASSHVRPHPTCIAPHTCWGVSAWVVWGPL